LTKVVRKCQVQFNYFNLNPIVFFSFIIILCCNVEENSTKKNWQSIGCMEDSEYTENISKRDDICRHSNKSGTEFWQCKYKKRYSCKYMLKVTKHLDDNGLYREIYIMW